MIILFPGLRQPLTQTLRRQACTEFGTYVSDYAKRWQRMLQCERDQRLRLEAMVEELAKQHCALEKKVEQTQAGSPAGATKAAVVVTNGKRKTFNSTSPKQASRALRKQDVTVEEYKTML